MNKNTTKAELKAVLEGYASVVTEKSLKDRIAYTLKKYSESTKKTVLDLISDIEKALTPATPLPVENSSKPTLKKSGKKSAKKADPEPEEVEEPETEAEEPEEQPKKSAKNSKGKSKPTLSKPKSTKGATEYSAPMAAIFPEKIEDPNIGTLVAVPDKYHTMAELKEAVEGDKTIVICAYFPMASVKKYGYSSTIECNKRIPKKGFAHDLDIQQVIYCCEGLPRAYALSDYTEAMFYYDEDMLEPIPTKDSETGKEVLTRFANGCEFELYEVVEDAE